MTLRRPAAVLSGEMIDPRWPRVAIALLLTACASATSPPSPAPATAPPSQASVSTATPGASLASDCRVPAELTATATEGPYFKAGSPERASLVEPGMPGTRLVLAGRVLSRSCAPIASALLDFWQADANGDYDNAGYRLRGHLFADAQGRYRLESVVPGLYPGRTRHLHVKVQAPGRTALTTQLYFPEEQRNAADSIFRPDLVVRVERSATQWTASFDFVLELP